MQGNRYSRLIDLAFLFACAADAKYIFVFCFISFRLFRLHINTPIDFRAARTRYTNARATVEIYANF